jgi:hypothetical protein
VGELHLDRVELTDPFARLSTVVTDGPVWYKDAGTDRMPCPARIFHPPAATADLGSA